MYDHVTIGASDRERSRRFYGTVLAALGRERVVGDPTRVEWGDLSIAQAGEGRPVTTGLHIGFAAPSRAHVDAFWRAGREAGHADAGAPGPRPRYRADYYGAFLLDPDGNSAEAVVHGDLRADGGIDHLWVRVADRPASRRFLALAGEVAGFAEVAHLGDRTRFSPGPRGGSLSIVDGERPTTPFHLAFGAPDRGAVERFHAAATAAGHADEGAPGLRPEYHAHYFGAFVRDPDGHDVELVHHGR